MKFSVIIPCYNAEKYIVNCLDSICNNDYKDYEVILINDGSTDDTHEIIMNYISRYENFIYIKQDNKGVSAARNIGLEVVKGDYVTFVDADDTVSKNYFIVSHVKILRNAIFWF